MHPFALNRDLLVSRLRVIPEARIHSLAGRTAEREEVVDFLPLSVVALVTGLLHFLLLVSSS